MKKISLIIITGALLCISQAQAVLQSSSSEQFDAKAILKMPADRQNLIFKTIAKQSRSDREKFFIAYATAKISQFGEEIAKAGISDIEDEDSSFADRLDSVIAHLLDKGYILGLNENLSQLKQLVSNAVMKCAKLIELAKYSSKGTTTLTNLVQASFKKYR
jgi:hypothetical protein